jgi:hypothetical protein
MSKIKLIYDFFRLWIKWKDWREAWEDAKFINDKKIQKELEEESELIKERDTSWDDPQLSDGDFPS